MVIISVKTNFFIKKFKRSLIQKMFLIIYTDIHMFFFLFLIAYKSLYPFADVKFQEHYSLTMYVKLPAISKLRKDYDDIFTKKNVRDDPASLINKNNKFDLNQFKKFIYVILHFLIFTHQLFIVFCYFLY